MRFGAPASSGRHAVSTDVANHADTDVLKKKYRGNIIDVSPVEYISLTINGGYRGMDERKKYYALAQQVLVD